MLNARQQRSTNCWNLSPGLSPPFITYAMSDVSTNGVRSLQGTVSKYYKWLNSVTAHSFIHFWHAPLWLHSAKHRHHSPEWTILNHVNCFIQGEVQWFQVLLGSLHPCSTGGRPGGLLQFSKGEAVKICLASDLSDIRAMWLNSERRCAWIVAERCVHTMQKASSAFYPFFLSLFFLPPSLSYLLPSLLLSPPPPTVSIIHRSLLFWNLSLLFCQWYPRVEAFPLLADGQ